MANAAVVVSHRVQGRPVLSLIGRLRGATACAIAMVSAEMTEARRELRLQQTMRGFDARHLRDLGLDRNAC